MRRVVGNDSIIYKCTRMDFFLLYGWGPLGWALMATPLLLLHHTVCVWAGNVDSPLMDCCRSDRLSLLRGCYRKAMPSVLSLSQFVLLGKPPQSSDCSGLESLTDSRQDPLEYLEPVHT